jgi:hypothetical protein
MDPGANHDGRGDTQWSVWRRALSSIQGVGLLPQGRRQRLDELTLVTDFWRKEETIP